MKKTTDLGKEMVTNTEFISNQICFDNIYACCNRRTDAKIHSAAISGKNSSEQF